LVLEFDCDRLGLSAVHSIIRLFGLDGGLFRVEPGKLVAVFHGGLVWFDSNAVDVFLVDISAGTMNAV
jgi:hypothetical protein